MVSDACACSEPTASRVSPSIEKVKRSAASRSSTSETRRVASMSSAVLMHGVVVDGLGEQPLHGREVALDQQRRHGLLVGA